MATRNIRIAPTESVDAPPRGSTGVAGADDRDPSSEPR